MSEPSPSSIPGSERGAVVFERLHADVVLPERATAGSAGCDLRAYVASRVLKASDGFLHEDLEPVYEDGAWGVTLRPQSMALIPLGFRTQLPLGIEAQIRPRSGQVFKRALTVPNAPGTIDADYAEEWMVMVRNDSPVPRRIVHGERIAQVVFARYEALEIVEGEVTRTTERAGGFGSTGTG